MAYEAITENPNFKEIIQILLIPNIKMPISLKHEYLTLKYNFTGSAKMLERYFKSENLQYNTALNAPSDILEYCTKLQKANEEEEEFEALNGGFMEATQLEQDTSGMSIEETIKHYILLITKRNLEQHITTGTKLQTELIRLFSSHFKAKD